MFHNLKYDKHVLFSQLFLNKTISRKAVLLDLARTDAWYKSPLIIVMILLHEHKNQHYNEEKLNFKCKNQMVHVNCDIKL